MASSLDLPTAETLAVLLGIAAVLGFVYVFHRLRLRRRDLAARTESPSSEEDRAFNAIRLARAGADRMAEEGYDVDTIRQLVAEAVAAERRRDSASALQFATQARESLVTLRSNPFPSAGGLGAGADARAAHETSPPDSELLGSGGGWAGPAPAVPSGSSEEPPRAKLPPHQVEARFAISALERDLGGTAPAPANGTRGEAAEYLGQARSAYARADYSEAWRLALRGRRRIGGPVESVTLSFPRPDRPASSPAEVPPAGERGPDEISGAAICSSCGRRNGPADRFCRGCGRSLGPLACARCGVPNSAEDRYCGGCGAPLGPGP